MASDAPQITLTWPQHNLLIEVLDEFINEYTGSDVAMARRILMKLFDAESRWYAQHPEAQAALDEIKRQAREISPQRRLTVRAGS